MLPKSVARSSSGTLMIGRIAYQREGVTGVHSAGEVYLRLPCFTEKIVGRCLCNVQERRTVAEMGDRLATIDIG